MATTKKNEKGSTKNSEATYKSRVDRQKAIKLNAMDAPTLFLIFPVFRWVSLGLPSICLFQYFVRV